MSRIDELVDRTSRLFPESPPPEKVYPPPAHGARMKKHDVAVLWAHWFNAAVWLALLGTGGALVLSGNYQIAPDFFRRLVVGLFGSRENLLLFHITVGVLWIVLLVPYALFGYRSYFIPFLTKSLRLEREDVVWLWRKARSLFGADVELPHQGNYNAGQKLFGILVVLATAALMVTGPIMSFHLIGQGWVAWSIVIHFIAAALVFSGLFVHIYMAAFMPNERPAFFSMFSGQVDAEYAYHHHYKWYQEVMNEHYRSEEGEKK